MLKKFLEGKRKEKQLKEEAEKRNTRAFILKKINLEEAKSMIKEQFQDSNNYLQVDHSMIIGNFQISDLR